MRGKIEIWRGDSQGDIAEMISNEINIYKTSIKKLTHFNDEYVKSNKIP